MRKIRMKDLSPEDRAELIVRAEKSKAAQVNFGTCELCETQNVERRPYGPKGENICFDCGMKNRGVAERQFRRSVFGENIN